MMCLKDGRIPGSGTVNNMRKTYFIPLFQAGMRFAAI